MKQLIIAICVLLFSFQAKAHQPDLSSTILVEQGDNNWILQIRAALTAFEYEIHQHYGEKSYESPEEFQELVLQHVMDNVSILFNEASDVQLKNGLVKLGHETSVTLEVKGVPEAIQSLNLKNSSFGDIPRNQSALIFLKKGFSKDQFTLKNSNNHTVKLKVNNSSFELMNSIPRKTKSAGLYIAGALLACSMIFFALRNRY